MPPSDCYGKPSHFADIGSTYRQARLRTPGKVSVRFSLQVALDSWFCSTGGWIGNSSPCPIQERSARATRAVAVEAARKEGFPGGTIIFLDQEEGGRMLPEQRAYVYAWVDAVNASGYRAGVYCSGIPAREKGGATIITANDLQDNANGRKIVFFVYNDSCPPSPGCAFPRNPPSPQQSGVPFASIWQFAQSPRRREITARCPSKYDADGNCYAPLFRPTDGLNIDIDSADSPDPSADLR